MNAHAFKVTVNGGTNYHRRLLQVNSSDDNIGRDLPPNTLLRVEMRFTAATSSDFGWLAGQQATDFSAYGLIFTHCIILPGTRYRFDLGQDDELWATNPGGFIPGNGIYSFLILGLFPQYP